MPTPPKLARPKAFVTLHYYKQPKVTEDPSSMTEARAILKAMSKPAPGDPVTIDCDSVRMILNYSSRIYFSWTKEEKGGLKVSYNLQADEPFVHSRITVVGKGDLSIHETAEEVRQLIEEARAAALREFMDSYGALIEPS